MPQLEKGYTRIADEILENMAKTKLNGTQYRILMIVWRSTYGWQKKEHDLSLNYLVKATEINKRQIQRELNVMIEKGILIEKQKPSFNNSRIIAFNKNYTERPQATKKTTGDILDTSTGSELDTSTGDGLDTQNKELNKHINKYKSVYDYYLTLDLVKHKKYTKEMTKAMKHAESNLGIDVDEMMLMLKRHEQKVKSSKGEFKVKARPLAEFFGQKKYKSTCLICSDYINETVEEKRNNVVKIDRNNIKEVKLCDM